MKSILSWVGGKSRLVNTLVPLFPKHQCYCEVFAGAAWVLFHKPPSRVELINDRNQDLVALYRVIQRHPKEFMRCLSALLVSRDEYKSLVQIPLDALTDIERAVRLFYLVRFGYGAKIDKPSFTTSNQRARLNAFSIKRNMVAAHQRLSQVTVENKPYRDFIERYDGSEVFMYLDPPYWGREALYGKGLFERQDFEVLAAMLKSTQAKWMMSINDVPDIRTLFGQFNLREVGLDYSLGVRSGKTHHQVTELVITNYETHDVKPRA